MRKKRIRKKETECKHVVFTTKPGKKQDRKNEGKQQTNKPQSNLQRTQT
jgi:hypothetical protein